MLKDLAGGSNSKDAFDKMSTWLADAVLKKNKEYEAWTSKGTPRAASSSKFTDIEIPSDVDLAESSGGSASESEQDLPGPKGKKRKPTPKSAPPAPAPAAPDAAMFAQFAAFMAMQAQMANPPTAKREEKEPATEPAEVELDLPKPTGCLLPPLPKTKKRKEKQQEEDEEEEKPKKKKRKAKKTKGEGVEEELPEN